jgi:hypothetical protein
MQAASDVLISRAALVSSVISFAFGLISAVWIDALKRRREKQNLISLFLAEIRRIWSELDKLKMAPVGSGLTRGRTELFGVSGFNFHGAPEYQLEVYNAKLFETEGVKLAQQLRPKGRSAFWAAYGYLRDAESIRVLVKNLPREDQDRAQYEKLFVALAGRATEASSELEKALGEERAWIENLREALR